MKEAVLLHKDRLYLFDGRKFSTIEPKRAKKFRVGALVPVRQIVTLTFKLPSTIDHERLAVQVELKMYNEGGLDPNKEYAIDYLVYQMPNEEEYLVEAFALCKEDIDPLLEPFVSKIGFLDILFPKFIAYESLYVDKEAQSDDLIIYIGEEEAFGVIYQKGRYIGYRTIDSLSQLSKAIGIEQVRLKALLANKGLIQSKYAPEEMHIFDALQERFYKMVEKLVYAINHKRSFYGLEGIDRIILDFDGETIEGLDAFIGSFGMEIVRYEPLECCGFDSKQSSLATEAYYLLRYDELPQKINLTFYERGVPWYRYELFRYTAVAVAALLAVVGVLVYLDMEESRLQELIQIKEARLERIKAIDKKLLAKLQKLRQERKALQKQLKELEEQKEVAEETLEAIPFIQKAKLDRERMMNDIVKALYTYRLTTRAIDQNGTREAFVDLISKDEQRDRIARFMQYLLQRNYQDVQTKKIQRKDGLYESVVRVAP